LCGDAEFRGSCGIELVSEQNFAEVTAAFGCCGFGGGGAECP